MTLPKAIEILTSLLADRQDLTGTDLANSIKLLIEAGKVLQHGRLIGMHFDPVLLPGETKE